MRTREKVAEIIKEWFPNSDILPIYSAADEIEDYILETYGPPF